jgi:hypothetical protein
VEAAELGAAFTVPRGWQGVWPPEAEMFVMRSETDPGLHVLAMAEEASPRELEALMSEQIDLGDGISLAPAGPVSHEADHLVARYQVRGAQSPLSAYARARAGSNGIAIAFLALAPAESLAGLEPVVTSLIEGTTLAAPAPAAAGGSGTQASGSQQTWAEYLRGKYIVRYHTSSGYTDEQHLWLCSDGSFARRGAAGGFGGGASGAAQSDSTGRWQAEGAGASGTLVLAYPDGSVARYALSWDYEKSRLFLDGERWLHDDNQRCR